MDDFSFLKSDKESLNKIKLKLMEFIEDYKIKTIKKIESHLQNTEGNSRDFILLELNIIESRFESFKNENLEYSNELNCDFMVKQIKPLFIKYYISFIKVYKKRFKIILNENYLLNENSCKNYFDLNSIYSLDFEAINDSFKRLKLLPEHSKKVTLENLFRKDNQGKLIWSGKINELNYFIFSLKEHKIILDVDYWKISKVIFMNEKNEKFKNLETPRGKNIPKIANNISEIIQNSIKKKSPPHKR